MKGEELVEEPFQRLIQLGRLRTRRTRASGPAIDTFKEKVTFDTMVAKGDTPWMLWKPGSDPAEDATMLAEACIGAPPRTGLCCSSARTATTSRSGAAPPCSRCVERFPTSTFNWVVLGSDEHARAEASRRARRSSPARRASDDHGRRASATASCRTWDAEMKEYFEALKAEVNPDLIFTHYRHDRAPGPPTRLRADLEHVARPPDPRVRDPQVRRRPGIPERLRRRPRARRNEKLRILNECYGTQRSRAWFSDDTFLGLMRLRGVEGNTPSGYAEAFYSRKLAIDV